MHTTMATGARSTASILAAGRKDVDLLQGPAWPVSAAQGDHKFLRFKTGFQNLIEFDAIDATAVALPEGAACCGAKKYGSMATAILSHRPAVGCETGNRL
jgi:hypothetical protein